MAIFNTARLLDVLVRGRIAEAAPAAELVDELEEQMTSALSEYPTHDRLGLMEERLLRMMAEMETRLLRELAELRQQQAEMEARMTERMAELEARMTRLVLQALGIGLGGVALAVGILLGFG